MGEDVGGDDKERPVSFITLIEHQHQETIHLLHSLDEKLELLQRLGSVGFNAGVQSPNIDMRSAPGPDPQIAGLAAITSPTPASEGSSNTWNRLNPSRSDAAQPQLLQSYTGFDKQLREDAEEAHADLENKRISNADLDLPEETPSWAKQVSSSPYFDAFFAAVVLLNAIFIGIEVEVEIRNPNEVYTAMVVLQGAFTVLFAIELIVRLCAGGFKIFWGEDYAWSLLDLFIVLTSTWEILTVLQGELGAGPMGVTSLKALRIIRLTRVFKTAQVMRIFRFVLPLRTLVRSIMHTLKALIWALLLLFLVVYVFAVLFTQTVNIALGEIDASSPELRDVQRYFGNLLNTMLSLFMSIAGGVSWEAVIEPLWFISPVWALLFLFYISFTYFAVLNVVTGVFCQSAMESAQNDHLTVAQSLIDNRAAHIERLQALFEDLGSIHGGITFNAFEDKMGDPAVREYFETLGINVYDAWSFFKLLDADGGGCVEAEEFFEGCLRFRGQARAMEVGKVLQDQQWLIRSQSQFQSFVEEELNSLQRRFSGLVELMISITTSISRIHGNDGTPARMREL